MKKLLSFLLLFCTALPLLTSCAKDEQSTAIRYSIPTTISNLDPQFATDSYAQNILYNTFEGLFVQLPSGEIVNGAVDSYTLSADQTQYTFQLKQGLTWSNGTPLTANDFEFALKRLFYPQSTSPFASNFSSIKNASAILAGTMDYTALQVTATSDTTLIITLEYPDPFFLEQLCSTAAYPCNQAFFEESKGRYGLNLDSLLFNGPFYLSSWNSNRTYLTLRKNESYHAQADVVNTLITIDTNVTDGEASFLDGTTDLSSISFETAQDLSADKYQLTTFQNTVWVMVFNLHSEELSNKEIRAGIVAAMHPDQLEENLPANYQLANSIVPQTALLANQPYHTLAQGMRLSIFENNGRQLFQTGLQALGLTKLSQTTVFIADVDNHANYLAHYQQMWQQEISTFLNMQELSTQELLNRVSNGNFSIAIIPITLSEPNPYWFFNQFTSQSTRNYVGYQNTAYDTLLTQALSAATTEQQANLLSQCEQMLIDDAVIVPLYTQTSYYAANQSIGHYAISPFHNRIYFAQR